MKIIIDTDMMIDDWMAILFLLANKEIEVLGMSISGVGGNYLIAGAKNAKTLLKIFNRDTTVDVCKGLSSPLLYSNSFPKKIRDDAADFMGLKFPPSSAPLSGKSIAQFYDDILNSSSEKVSILSIGGGTNLGSYLGTTKYKDKIGSIVVMGGAMDVPGNLKDLTDLFSYNQVAEWNCFIDPRGMKNIFSSGCEVVLVPLDICNKIFLTKQFTETFSQQATQVGSKEELEMMQLYIQDAQYPVFDPLAGVILSLLGNGQFGQVVSSKKESVSITQTIKTSGEEDNCAQTYRDESGSQVTVCYDIQQADFEKYFLAAFTS